MAESKPRRMGWGALLAATQKKRELENSTPGNPPAKKPKQEVQAAHLSHNGKQNVAVQDGDDTKTKQTNTKAETKPPIPTTTKPTSTKPTSTKPTGTKPTSTKNPQLSSQGSNTKEQNHDDVHSHSDGDVADEERVQHARKKPNWGAILLQRQETRKKAKEKKLKQRRTNVTKLPHPTNPTFEEEKLAKQAVCKKTKKLIQAEFQKTITPFFEFTVSEPVVVVVPTTDTRHEYYLDLLAKSYANNFSAAVTFANSKIVVGFDVEMVRKRPYCIQISTATLCLIFLVDGLKTLSNPLQTFFSSRRYVKCGVGVAEDLTLLHSVFGIKFGGIFDASIYARDLQLTPGRWELQLLGMEILGFGKIHQFRHNGGALTEKQVHYAARDAWLGYSLVEYFYDCLKTEESGSLYSFCATYVSEKNWDSLLENAVENKAAETPSTDQDQGADQDKGAADPSGSGSESGSDNTARKIRSNSDGSEPTASHLMRNKLEQVRDLADKARREEQRLQQLVNRLSENNVEQQDSDEENQVLLNWT